MKKLVALMIIAGMVSFVACGTNKKELAAKQLKVKQDSILKVDSLAKVDSIAKALVLKAKQDSTKKADSIAKVKPIKKTVKKK